MTVLPEPARSSSASGLELVDFREDVVTSAAAGADFTATAEFDQVEAPYFWLIDRMVVSTTTTKPTTARIYRDYVDPLHLVNATGNGNLDVDDASSPLLVDTGSQLLVVWTGDEAGFRGTARVQYRLMVRS